MVYAAWLLVWLLIFYALVVTKHRSFMLPPAEMSDFCSLNVSFLLWQQSCLLWLAAPAFAAGAITEEKTRGTILYLLTTELTALEIVRDKVAGKVIQISVIALAGLPLIVWFGAFIGFGPVQWLLLLALLLQVAGLVSAGILASVCCRSTTTAALSVYVISGLWFVAAWLNGAGFLFFPFHLWRQSLFEDQPWQRLLAFAGFWVVVICACFPLSVLFLRRFSVGHNRPKKRQRFVRRPPVGANPLRWKEQFVNRPLPYGVLSGTSPRLLRLMVIIITSAVGLLIVWLHLPAGATLDEIARLLLNRNFSGIANIWLAGWPAEEAFAGLGISVMMISATLVATRAAGSVSGEREQGTWDVLLAAPLEPRQLLRGKLWGIIDITRPYLVAYLMPALLVSTLGGIWSVAWVAFLWLATWIMLYFVGASGIYCSVRSQTSWRSLLAALITNSWAVFMRYCFLGAPLGIIAAGVVSGFASGGFWNVRLVFNVFLFTSSCVTLILLFARAEFLLEQAEKWFSEHERISQVQELSESSTKLLQP